MNEHYDFALFWLSLSLFEFNLYTFEFLLAMAIKVQSFDEHIAVHRYNSSLTSHFRQSNGTEMNFP